MYFRDDYFYSRIRIALQRENAFACNERNSYTANVAYEYIKIPT